MATSPNPSRTVARWAAVHASTIPARSPQAAPAAAPRPTPAPTPTVLASFTEARTLPMGGNRRPVAMAPDAVGRPLLAAGADETVQLWDPAAGDLLRTLQGGGTGVVQSVAWGSRPDGRPLLAAGGRDGGVRIWDVDAGELVHTLPPRPAPGSMNGCVLSWGYRPDGRPLLAAGWDQTLVIWNPDTEELLHTRTPHPGQIFSVALSHRSDRPPLLATGSTGGTVQIWDPEYGELLHTLTEHTGTVVAIAWAQRSDGTPLMATASYDRTARVWTEHGGVFDSEALPLQNDGSFVDSVSWASLDDGRLLLAVTTQRGVHLYDGVTWERLHTESLNFEDSGYAHTDWTLTRDGRLLFAAPTRDGLIHVWDVVLDPPAPLPVRPTAASAAAGAERERATTRAAGPVTILDPPEDITPDVTLGIRIERGTPGNRVACAAGADGQLLAVVFGVPDPRIWDLSAGSPPRTLWHPQTVECAAFGKGASGRPLLATGCDDAIARIWDPHAYELVTTLSGHTAEVDSIAWGYRADGRPILATGGDDATTRIWDPDSGELLATLGGHTDDIMALAWGYHRDGRLMLATGSHDGTARIWDPDSGEHLTTLDGHSNGVWSLVWGERSDGRPFLATAGGDNPVRIWDPDTGARLSTITGRRGNVFALDWTRLSDGRQLLASGSDDGIVRLWDPETAAELASAPCQGGFRQTVSLARDGAGDVCMMVANPAGFDTPVGLWRIAIDPPAGPGAATADPAEDRPGIAELSRQLPRLGAAGLWPPLGLLADLIALTGQPPANATALCDGRLAALAGEPGITRLRDLGWEPTARSSFAALLASGLDIPDQYTAPPDADPATLPAALLAAIAQRNGPIRSGHVSPSDVRAATSTITEQTVTLLSILGPAACAADPLLPVRLAHRIPQLPALSPADLRLLTLADASRPTAAATGTGTLHYSPGTAGLALTGPLTRLLPTQLALPRDLLTIRLAESQLLYRQHRAPAPPAPEPVTIILDTTPPTYGPAGTTLRLAAHLITTTLWHHDRHPHLVTLADPNTITELRTPGDLLTIWTSATLDDPAPALAAALATAAPSGQPTLFGTHFKTARDRGYSPGPATRLLTAHQPPEQPPRRPIGRWHQHLPPSPTQAQLTTAIGRLLGGGPADGN